MRISTKLILILATAVVTVMAVYALVTISRTQDRLDEELLKMAEHISMALQVGIMHHLNEGDEEGVKDVLEMISQYEDIIGVAIFAPDGNLMAASRSVAADLEDEKQLYTGTDGSGEYVNYKERRIYTYVRGVQGEDGKVWGSLKLFLGAKSLMPYVIEARNYILGTILVLTGVLTGLIVYFSQSQIAGPLRVLTEGANTIGKGELGHRIEIRGKGEIGALAEAFNGMAANLETTTQEIIREREFVRNIVDSMSEGIVVVDCQKQITAWNQAMEQRYGLALEAVQGKKLGKIFPDLFSSDFETRFTDLLKGNAPHLTAHKIILEATPEQILSITGSALRDVRGEINGAVLVLADITEQQHLEQQIQQSEKLAAVGQLAAGIAHEIGTPLNVISGSAEYLLMDVEEENSQADELKTIVSEVSRISELVKQLMTFARQEEPSEEDVDVRELLDSTLVLLRRQIEKQGIDVEIELEPDLPEIAGDRNQIQQILLNLIMNAWQAMPERGQLSLQGKFLPSRPLSGGVPNGRNISGLIELTVADTGMGIPEADLERIFDPFFTTKEIGQGTGLGLSLVQRMVENHHGRVTVSSREGEGAIFTVILPAYTKEQDDV
jgi:PAS domain S-box-containing protein